MPFPLVTFGGGEGDYWPHPAPRPASVRWWTRDAGGGSMEWAAVPRWRPALAAVMPAGGTEKCYIS